ncbi:glutamine amidotransferase [Corynebacterium bovis]|uniref:type 1 glutamine amidotransferase n=1 Tax=Corynebacterium bovis TaxID=36808 RepID=UPI00313949D9
MSDTDLTIGLVLPDVLGTYGDDGNALVLRQRARMRGLTAEIHRLTLGEPVPETLDVYTLGGGEDTAQIVATEHLAADGGLARAAAAGRPVLAICAGLQVLGESFRASGRVVEGLGILDATTSGLAHRMIGEIRSEPVTPAAPAGTGASAGDGDSAGSGAGAGAGARTGTDWTAALTDTLTGFANHMGATILGPDARPLGRLTHGTGNTDAAGAAAAGLDGEEAERQIRAEGVVQGSVVATYMHGPALARNPQLADALLAQATGTTVAELPPLDGELAEQVTREVARLRAERLRS